MRELLRLSLGFGRFTSLLSPLTSLAARAKARGLLGLSFVWLIALELATGNPLPYLLVLTVLMAVVWGGAGPSQER